MSQTSAKKGLLIETAGETSGLRKMSQVKGLNWFKNRKLAQIKQNVGESLVLEHTPDSR